MQAQTTRKHYSGLQKIAGGVLVAAALVTGAVGLTTVGDLEVPGAGSDAQPARPAVVDIHAGSRLGEGLPRSVVQPDQGSAEPDGRIAVGREMTAPLGEGFPKTFEEREDAWELPKLGEGLPKSTGQ